MTVSSTNNRNDYIGNDSTAIYNYTFRVFLETEIQVTVKETATDTETALVLNTDFSVQDVGDEDGTITLLGTGKAWQGTGSNLATGYTLTLRRIVALTQNTDIRNQGDYYIDVPSHKYCDHVPKNLFLLHNSTNL